MQLETERLIVRPLGARDLDHFLELHREPLVVEFLGPTTPELARERLKLCERTWKERGHDLLALIERSSGRFVGRSGLRYWPEWDESEVGWVLHRRAWGRGYATEAARAIIGWGFDAFPLPYITAMIRPDNSRSLAVAGRLGLKPIRDDFVFGIPVIVHAIDRSAWGARGSTDADVVQRLLAHVVEWAPAQAGLMAVGVGPPRSSGAELVFLSRSPDGFPDAEEWAGELGGAVALASARRGDLIEHRLGTPSGLELQITIGRVPPADVPWRALYDPEGVLSETVPVNPARDAGAGRPAAAWNASPRRARAAARPLRR